MKRSILLIILTLFVAVNASAQRKVLVEEFTSSTCPPCASTDPIMEAWEAEAAEQVVVLKYHQNYPASGDIMYNAYKEGRARHDYYGVAGIPHVEFNGMANTFPQSVVLLNTTMNQVIDQSSVYYNVSVSQQVTADSIIALVTVKAGADVDPEARLVVVIAEANVIHQGSNGRTYHTMAVRGAMPAFDAEGAPAGPALTIAANGEQTFRFSTPLKTVWNKDLLQLAAFVQNPTSREVMGVETSVPNLSLVRKGGNAGIVGSTTIRPRWVATNNGTTSQTVKFTAFLSKATPYTGTVTMADGSAIPSTGLVLAPGADAEIMISFATSGANTEKQNYLIGMTTVEGVGVKAPIGLVWPGESKNVFVDAGVTRYSETLSGFAKYTSALTNAGMTTPSISYEDLLNGFGDLTHFKNIFWSSGYVVGLYTGAGEMSESDTHKVRQFIANGGNLAFSSTLMAGTYGSNGLGEYVEEVFGVTAEPAVQSSWEQLFGTPGDVLGNGIEADVEKQVLTQALEVSDLNSTSTAFLKNENEEIMGVRTEHAGGGKVVYLSFEPGNITSTTIRRTLVKNIVDWFNGVADVAPSTIADAGYVANYPNPFNSNTTISFELDARSNVSLVVQDMMGREVASLINNQMIDAGAKAVKFDGSDLANGNYLYVLTVDGKRTDGKMTIAK